VRALQHDGDEAEIYGMRIQKHTLLIWGIGLFDIGLLLFSTIIDGFQPDPDLYVPIALVYIVLGGLIAHRNPRNAIGWIFLVAAFILYAREAMFWYAKLGLQVEPGLVPAAGVIAALTGVMDYIGYELLLIFTFLLFPSGRLLSRRWLPIFWLAVFSPIIQFLEVFRPGPLVLFPSWDNPMGIEQLAGYFEVSGTLNGIITAILFIIGPIALIVRYRGAPMIERQQIKWFAFAGIIVSIILFILIIFDEILPPMVDLLGAMILLSILPLAIAIAILRYNLWDIDLIIRRTLQYTLLTGLLALVYFGTVLVLENLVVRFTGQGSPVVIVISTLTIATLFNPLRTQVQEFIDLRFYRKKYDAEQALAQFAAIARDEVDIDKLTGSLMNVVQETLQPEVSSLWIISYDDR
jgi:hypothetical protein